MQQENTGPEPSQPQSEGILLLLDLLCPLIRSSKLQESKVRPLVWNDERNALQKTAIRLMAEISESCSPECRLNIILPYFLAMLFDGSACVRASALHFLLKMLSSVRNSSMSEYERRLYPDYILPSLSLLPNDSEELVRVEYASGVPEMTSCALNYLQKEIASKLGDGTVAKEKYEKELSLLRDRIMKVILELISGERSTSATRRALSASVSKLATFYGPKKIQDLLLLLPTFMNDSNSSLKICFFECIRQIDAKSLSRSLEALLPCLDTVCYFMVLINERL